MDSSTALAITPSSPIDSPSNTSLVVRWKGAAHQYLTAALAEDNAGNAQRWTIAAGIATDKYLVLDGRPTQVVEHIHTVDLESIGLKLQAALARVMQVAHASGVPARPAAIDVTCVPLDLGGPMGRHHDVGTSSGVPSPDRAALQHDAPRRRLRKGGGPIADVYVGNPAASGGGASGSPTRRKVRKVYPAKPGNHGPATLDPANPLKKARLRLNRRAARLAKAAAKVPQP